MSSVSKNQERPIPLMLILLLLAAVVLSSVLGYIIPFATAWLLPRPFWQMQLSSLVYQASSFPFWLTCVVWLAARCGRTTRSTWIVPMVILVILSATWVAGWLAALLNARGSYLNLANIIFMQWSISLRACLFEFVLLAFAFRVTTLHLRPVDVAALPHRLTVLSILVLTSIVAIGLGVDAFAYQQISANAPFAYLQNSPFNLVRTLTSLFYQLLNAFLWFSTAWLFVAKNPMRWIGTLGLVIYVLLIGIYYLLLLPVLVNQQPVPPGTRMATFGPFFFLGSFAVSLSHVALVFLCVGMMHLAGYRWDIRRSLLKDAENDEMVSDGVPPLLGSRI